MEHLAATLFEFLIIVVSAKLVGELFEHIHQPAVVGELLVGMLIGPHALGLIHTNDFFLILSEFAVIFLLFQVGLETRLLDMLKVGMKSFWVAVLGVVLPFMAGYAYLSALNHDYKTALFLGAAMVATSVGITARVLGDLSFLRNKTSRIILGAAVIDDILGMIILAMVAGLSQGEFTVPGLVMITVKAVSFVVLVVVLGSIATKRYGHLLSRLKTRNMPFIIAMMICLGLSALAQIIGLAAIIGAFLAGMVFAEVREDYQLDKKLEPMTDLMVPIFFVIMGAGVNTRLFINTDILVIALIVTLIAILTKLVGCGIAVFKDGWHTSLIVGIGMVPRGEVGLIIAAIGARMKIFPDDIYAIIVFMCMATTLFMPPFMKLAVDAKNHAAARQK
jgi:Kef-type K+ transport system membrane component KefB